MPSGLARRSLPLSIDGASGVANGRSDPTGRAKQARGRRSAQRSPPPRRGMPMPSAPVSGPVDSPGVAAALGIVRVDVGGLGLAKETFNDLPDVAAVDHLRVHHHVVGIESP